MVFQQWKFCCATYYFKVESLTNKSTRMMHVNVLYGKAVNGNPYSISPIFFLILQDRGSFYVATVTPVLDFPWRLSWFLMYPYLLCFISSPVCTVILQFSPNTTSVQHLGSQESSVRHFKILISTASVVTNDFRKRDAIFSKSLFSQLPV